MPEPNPTLTTRGRTLVSPAKGPWSDECAVGLLSSPSPAHTHIQMTQSYLTFSLLKFKFSSDTMWRFGTRRGHQTALFRMPFNHNSHILARACA